MASRFLNVVSQALVQLERIYFSAMYRVVPQPELIPVMIEPIPSAMVTKNHETFDVKEIFDGFLWGVPTCRRSVEKRMMRKYGAPRWHNKLILPKTDLGVCLTCGHYHEKNRLCPNCYAKVKNETKEMQDKIVQELGLNPIEKEVVVVYDGENAEHQTNEYFQGKRIVEMEKPRPKWFTKNLLQKSGPVTETDISAVKPHDLG